MNRLKDFTEMNYLLAEGKEKARMTKEIELRETRTWSGALLSTAEHSLSSKSNQNSGLRVRIFEFGNGEWTKSAEHAENLSKGLMQNYGWAGPPFVAFLLKIGKETVQAHWAKWSKVCYERMVVKDGLSKRIAEKFAWIMTTAELLNECFTFELNVDGILQLLIQTEQETASERDLGERAYEYFKEIVIINRTKFAREDQALPANECWGKIVEKDKSGLEIDILTNQFKKLMAERGFEDWSVVLKKWKEMGYLDYEEGKNSRRKAVPNTGKDRVPVYCVLFKENFLDFVEEEHKEKKRSFGLNGNKRGIQEVSSLDDLD